MPVLLRSVRRRLVESCKLARRATMMSRPMGGGGGGGGGGARVLPPSDTGVDDAGALLRDGKLVAFPTETVYGLGANALDERAVLDIFAVKGRPLTDPLIVHVLSLDAALGLVELDGRAREVFCHLAGHFWPGALTLVAKARSTLPLCLTAGTGFVGLRCPSHPLARRLLGAAGVPIAAPSANRFGHVSPTSAEHVIADLGKSDIAVLNGDVATTSESAVEEGRNSAHPPCEFGIESTVCKVDAVAGELQLFRRGAVTERALVDALRLLDCGDEFAVRVLQNAVPVQHHYEGGGGDDSSSKKQEDEAEKEEGKADADADTGAVDDLPERPTKMLRSDSFDHDLFDDKGRPVGEAPEEEEGAMVKGQEAPGQLLTHYAPDVDTYLVHCRGEGEETKDDEEEEGGGDGVSPLLASSVVIDFAGRLKWLQPHALAYRDLSTDGVMTEAARSIFSALRWTETVAGANRVLLVDLSVVDDEHAPGVSDRMFRAASGKRIRVARGCCRL